MRSGCDWIKDSLSLSLSLSPSHSLIIYLNSELLRVEHFVDDAVVHAFLRTKISYSTSVFLNHSEILAATLKKFIIQVR